MKKDKSNIKEELRTLRSTVSLVHGIDKKYFPIVIIHSLLDTAKYFLALVMSAYILDELIGERLLDKIILYVGIIIVGSLALKLAADLMQRMKDMRLQSMRHSIYCRMSEKILNIDYEYIDSPHLHNLRQKVLEYDTMNGLVYNLTLRISGTISAIVQILASVSISVSIFTTSVANINTTFVAIVNLPYWSILLVGIMVWVMYSQVKATKEYGVKRLEMAEDIMYANRMFGYFLVNICHKQSNGKDFRMYDTNKLFDSALNYYVDTSKKLFKKNLTHKIRIEDKATRANSISTWFIYLFVVIKAYVGAITIGSIIKYVGAIQKLSMGISELLVGVAELRVVCKFAKNLIELLELPDKMYHGTLPVEKREDHQYDIEFRNVSFKYPGSKEYVLRDVSFKLRIGERLAVVGMNGAGKTTMIKLLCRLYDPTEGRIYLNGIDVRKYDYDEYMTLFSVVFQDFKLFSFSVDQNIATSTEVDQNRLEECLKSAGVYDVVMSKKNGINTFIGKDFSKEGMDFSGGEMQKLAIARALYKDAPIVVLDEPTAALDPISEFEIYSRFDKLVGNKTAIYISHRLSSCRFCHDIMVFHEGAIIQRGSHDELIKHEGSKYHEMWNAQAQYYDETNEEMAS